MQGAVKVLVADAQAMLADALILVLRHYPNLEPIDSSPSSGREALEAIEEHMPQVALVDYWMEDLTVGDVMGTLNRHAPSCKLLLLSWSFSAGQIHDALAAGAAGFLPKSLSVDELVEGIERAVAGEKPVYGDRLARLVENLDSRWKETGLISERLKALTPKELEVLTLLTLGNLPEEVAKQMSISRGTVKVHIHSILKKTGARSHTEAVAMARYSGLLLS